MSALLEVQDIGRSFGGLKAVDGVSFDVREGEILGIIGPNGAGKTTLLRAIMGLLPVGAGSISLDGTAINGTPTWKMSDARVTMIPEGRMTFRDMSVEENLIMGAFPKEHRSHMPARLADAYAMFPRLHERRKQLAGSLSGGEAQMLAMARGLMSDPSLLIIDEPSLGLAPLVVNELFEILARLNDGRRTIILVEQNTARAVGVADHVYLMQSGKVALSQAAADVDLEHLHALYFAR